MSDETISSLSDNDGSSVLDSEASSQADEIDTTAESLSESYYMSDSSFDYQQGIYENTTAIALYMVILLAIIIVCIIGRLIYNFIKP